MNFKIFSLLIIVFYVLQLFNNGYQENFENYHICRSDLSSSMDLKRRCHRVNSLDETEENKRNACENIAGCFYDSFNLNILDSHNSREQTTRESGENENNQITTSVTSVDETTQDERTSLSYTRETLKKNESVKKKEDDSLKPYFIFISIMFLLFLIVGVVVLKRRRSPK